MKKLAYRYQFFIHATYSLQLCATGVFIAECQKEECSKSTVYLVSIALNIVGGFL
jgi:hypothetical protein